MGSREGKRGRIVAGLSWASVGCLGTDGGINGSRKRRNLRKRQWNGMLLLIPDLPLSGSNGDSEFWTPVPRSPPSLAPQPSLGDVTRAPALQPSEVSFPCPRLFLQPRGLMRRPSASPRWPGHRRPQTEAQPQSSGLRPPPWGGPHQEAPLQRGGLWTSLPGPNSRARGCHQRAEPGGPSSSRVHRGLPGWGRHS